ncbi:MAG: hypothetical protein C5B50_14180 [Verrucomicrobia bacterium]|nr:MAG: hypothetical protein C5B50_14180 [Verrucomicrobiota bacterium]
MPIHLPEGLRILEEREFKQITYEVMEIAFAVHNEMGCLFDELIYKQAIAQRYRDCRMELPIQVVAGTFSKTYYLDLLVGGGAPFEFKAAQFIVERHRAQFLNYLLLAELPHGKLVNFRGHLLEHEFINATWTRKQRTSFEVEDRDYKPMSSPGSDLKPIILDFLRDWGTCLDVELYQQAAVHFLGDQHAITPVEIFCGGAKVGCQKLHLLSPDTTLCISVLNDGLDRYEAQLRRLLKHTNLRATQWVNIGRKLVEFKTLYR